jgi:hypothetical protein
VTQDDPQPEPKPGEATSPSRFSSRKFVAYMLSNLLWKFLIFWAVYSEESDFIQMTLIIVSGCVDIGYILGQAALDAFLGWAGKLVDKVPEPPQGAATPPPKPRPVARKSGAS